MALSLFSPRAARAEGPDAPTGKPGGGESSAVTPPRLLESFEAEYPAEARATRIEGSVLLRLTINKRGEVIQAEVAEPAGHGFDEAAVAAAGKFRFEPARRGDTPVSVRINYRYDFRLPPDAPPAPPAAPERAPDRPSPLPPPSAQSLSPSPPSPSPSRATAPAPPSQTPIEVQVSGPQSESRRLRESAESVTLVETSRAKKQTRDLGDVLNTAEGASFRRTGGLGSFSRFSLNGLQDNQIRFFFDGVPLDVAGYSFGIASVPLNVLERVEIYRGVLPVRFGADALGGAVNLVPDRRYDTRAYASFQRGSFGTYRLALGARYRHEPSKLFVGVDGFFDDAKNDYNVEVEVADKTGQVKPSSVTRLHDKYRGYGGALELGVIDRPWAKRLLLRLYGSAYDKDIQNNILMSVPFGEAAYGEGTYGGTVQYEVPLPRDLSLSTTLGVARRNIAFVDRSEWVYDWNRRRVARRIVPGEITSVPHDATIWQDDVFGRAALEWRLFPEQALRIASTGRFSGRSGTERASTAADGSDPLAGRRDLFTLVTGLEYELNALDMRTARAKAERPVEPSRDDRLQNTVFAKHYFYSANAEGVYVLSAYDSLRVSAHRFGVGDGVRLRLSSFLSAKASYEYATRLPGIEEIYGDGLLISPNLELLPELSHNGNLGLQLSPLRTAAGRFTSEINGFVRFADQLIALLPDAGATSEYKNLFRARIAGIEGSLSYTSPGDWVALDGSATFQDPRQSDGERIPNRPWLFSSFSARLQLRNALLQGDEIAPFYIGRYVHEFLRSSGERSGDPRFKAAIPAQFSQSLGLSYSTGGSILRCTLTFEVDNIADAKLYDFFGVQRPGRSYALRVTGEI